MVGLRILNQFSAAIRLIKIEKKTYKPQPEM